MVNDIGDVNGAREDARQPFSLFLLLTASPSI